MIKQPRLCQEVNYTVLSVKSKTEKFMSTLERKLDMTELDEEAFKKAYKDLGVCLLSVAKTLRKVTGGSMGALGTTAGRISAGHLPHMFEGEKMSWEELLKDLQTRWKDSFDFDYTIENSVATLKFVRCPIYEILSLEGEKAGGDLCNLFHNYIQGIMVEVLKGRFQVKTEEAGEKCTVKFNKIPDLN